MNRVLLIAEAGVNHNGSIDMALQLVDSAAAAGADIVKFQTFAADRLTLRSAAKAEYQARGGGGTEGQYEMLKRLELSFDDHKRIMSRCAERGISFLSTAFDLESIDLLGRLGLKRWKIPSGEITDVPYLRKIGRLAAPVLLSTGMATMAEIAAALEILTDAGTPLADITVLHCTTEYPTPFQDVHLRAMLAVGAAFGVDVGYSDHTEGIEVAVAAAALGAKVIEKHFTLDRGLPGPDHSSSLEPPQLAAMVASVRNVERSLGSPVKRPTSGELETSRLVRKAIVAARPIKAGEMLTEENLTVKRPCYGISAAQWDHVVGRPARREYRVNEEIEW